MPGSISTPSHSALVALPIAVLDLETTGLDVRHDRIVQIGVVRMQGGDILASPRLDQLINPEIPIPALASGIHGIFDANVENAPRFADCADTLRQILSGCVVIGHHVAFDLAVLRYEASRIGIAWHDPPALDLARLTGALQPTLADVGLETVADLLGVVIRDRHTALGDCMIAAEAFTRLVPLLRDSDVRTFGEAQVLSEQRSDLVTREIQSGWHSVPGEPPPAPSEPALHVDSFVFSKRIGELMHSPPVMIAAEETLVTAARTAVELGKGALLVGTVDGFPEGILTERDLLRIVADRSQDLAQIVVREVMSHPVEMIAASALLYQALGRMDRMGIRHLCVHDDDGVAVGMITQRDLMHHRARATIVLGDALHEAEDLASLAAAFTQVPAVARQLVADGLSGREVAHVVSTEICSLTARAAEITRIRLAASGKKEPSARWCLLVLGSGGRGESLLSADQDNALIMEGETPDDEWYAELGQGTTDLLHAAGLRNCDGGVMASNATWRGSQAEWRKRVDDWLRRAKPEDLLDIDIFFDMVPVAGDLGLAAKLHEQAVDAASRTPTFLALLAQSVQAISPRFALFGKLRMENGRIDLKRDGLLSLVCLARVVALRLGSSARETPARLRQASAKGKMSDQDIDVLIDLHEQLLDLILRQQLADIENGIPPSSKVEIRLLSKKERVELKEGLHRLDQILPVVQSIVSR